MVETPALISRPPVYTGLAIAALVLGIISMLVPLLGVVTGIVAIIFGITALVKKTSARGISIAGIILGGIAFVGNVGIILLLSLIFGGHFSLPPSTRDNQVAAQVNEKKDFTSNETIKMGPIDVKITNVQRNYVLTADDNMLGTKGGSKGMLYSNTQNDPVLSEDQVEYVLVEGTEQINKSPFLGDDDIELSDMMLNNTSPYVYKGGLDEYRYPSASPVTAVPFSFIYRIEKGSESLTLERSVTIWAKVSAIVGTEGMPRKTLTYTIALK